MSCGAKRGPEFALLDELIVAGWGSIPQPKIPENWREITEEVRLRDLERIRTEELTPSKQLIAAIERANARVDSDLGAKVMANHTQRHGNRKDREQDMRERQIARRREAKSKSQREAITRAWNDPSKFQSRRSANMLTLDGAL